MSAATARHAHRPAPLRWTSRARRIGTTAVEGTVAALMLGALVSAAVIVAPTPAPPPAVAGPSA